MKKTEQSTDAGRVGSSDGLAEMCLTCPFCKDGPERDTLIRWAKATPHETWPCHEDDPDGLCIGKECQGRKLFAQKAANVQIEPRA